jgi:hypothetical protein
MEVKDMNDRSIEVTDLPVAGGQVIEVKVAFAPGRGYSLHMQPMRKSLGHGCMMREYEPTQGLRGLIKGAARFSRKKLEAHAAAVLTSELYRGMLAQVLADNGLTLAEEVTEAAAA